jgi:hypothetical protein
LQILILHAAELQIQLSCVRYTQDQKSLKAKRREKPNIEKNKKNEKDNQPVRLKVYGSHPRFPLFKGISRGEW